MSATSKTIRRLGIRVVMVLVPALLQAAPKIEVTPLHYNCGTWVAGKTEKVYASFTIKNTGDAPLKISRVKPGCGCTVAKYDSLVNPGKTGKMDATVTISIKAKGPLSRPMTVFSNASNEPELEVNIDMTILPIIDLAESFVGLNGQFLNVPRVVTLSSQKKDLKITSVAFQSITSDKPSWAPDLPPPIKFEFFPIDSSRKDGYQTYHLNLYSMNVTEVMNGHFMMQTNHPDMRELKLSGKIEK
jgi:hypothetical protein